MSLVRPLRSNDRWRQHASQGSVLQQAYLVATKGETVRIRTIDGRRAKLTVKIRSSRNRHEEYEYDIPYTDAKEMFEHVPGVLQKTHFEVDIRVTPGKSMSILANIVAS